MKIPTLFKKLVVKTLSELDEIKNYLLGNYHC